MRDLEEDAGAGVVEEEGDADNLDEEVIADAALRSPRDR